MCHAEFITAVKDVAVAVAGITTAIVAVLGLKSWSRELRGKANFEAARGLARAAYKLRDELVLCRNPFVRAIEFPEALRNPVSRKEGLSRETAYSHVFTNRWNTVFAALQEFDAQTLEAEALWGQPIREKTDALRMVVDKLYAAIDAFIDNEAAEGQLFATDQEFGSKIRAEIFAARKDTKNALSIELASAMAAIESELRPHLRILANPSIKN